MLTRDTNKSQTHWQRIHEEIENHSVFPSPHPSVFFIYR